VSPTELKRIRLVVNAKYMDLFVRRFLTCVFLVLVIALSGSGCASKIIRQEVVEVRSDSTGFRAVAMEQTEPAFEKISYRAYQSYINGLLAEGFGDVFKAAEFYGKALEYYPESYQIGLSYAQMLYRRKEIEDALRALRRLEPQDAEVLDLTARCYRELRKPDSVRAVYTRLVVLDSENTMAYSFLAGYYRQANDLDSTIWAYRNIVRLRPENYRNLNELANLLTQKGDYEKAREVYRRSLDAEFSHVNIRALINLGELYTITDQPDSAIITLEEGLELSSDNLLLNRTLASVYLSIDSVLGALPYAEKVVELSPMDFAANRRLGLLYFSLDSLETAESIFESLVESDDKHPLNHFYLGRIAGRSDNWEKARDEFTILTQLADSLFQSWLDLGFAYRRLEQPDKEIETYITGLTHMRDEPSAINLSFALGAAYEQSEQIHEAVMTFEEIIAHDPEHSQSLNYLGYMLADRGERLEYALKLIAHAVELVPDNAAYLDSYGWVHYRLGNFQEALKHLQRAVELDSDPIMFDHLGDTHHALGQMDEARESWLKALEQQPDNEQIKEKLGR